MLEPAVSAPVSPRSELPIQRTLTPRPRPPSDGLGFGRYFTDHAYFSQHDATHGWHQQRIVPSDSLEVDVSSGAVQYALSIFEGLKAHRGVDGQLRLFRPDMHAKRFAASARRLCMPTFDLDQFVSATRALVRVDADWYPNVPGGSLYIRPTLFASEAFLGVRPANEHRMTIVISPVGAYFAKGEKPLRLWAEREYVRAPRGGLGACKTGANYAASLLAAKRAQERGFDQVLWLDAKEHRYLEEVGTMNLMVRIGDSVVTPPLSDSILAGVTRDSILTILREWGVDVQERAISLDEMEEAHRAGKLMEIWGTGTAAVVSVVGELTCPEYTLTPKGGDLALKLRRAIEDLHAGRTADTHGWLVTV